MSQYYDLNNTGPQVQDRLDQTQENKQDIATLEGKVTAIENEIGESGQGGNTINARLDALETAVGSGGSVDERIAAAETEIIGGASSDYNTLGKVEGELEDTYRKNETYSKTELDNLITTPNVLYVTVIATNGTTDVTTLLPATGAADTVYRVGNWDGTQYDTTMYALYAWNGTAYVCLAVRSFVGEVYDISVNHPDGQGNPTPYADLAEALGNNGANIPADIRRGGMSIKFIQGTVQSSDNKYVQWRLVSDSFNTTPSNWQGVENGIVLGSQNLAKSGDVYLAVGMSGGVQTKNALTDAEHLEKSSINANGNITTGGARDNYDLYKITNKDYISIEGYASTYKGLPVVAFYSGEPSAYTLISTILNTNVNPQIHGINYSSPVPQNCKFILVQHETTQEATTATVSYVDSLKKYVDENLDSLNEEVDSLSDIVNEVIYHNNPETYLKDNFTLDGYYNSSDTGRTSGYGYKSLPLINVVKGEVIHFHKWYNNENVWNLQALCAYDNEGLPYNGVSAKITFAYLNTKDYVNGEFTFIVPDNCTQIGISYTESNYSLQQGANVVIGDEILEFTEKGRQMVNNAVESTETGDGASHYYLKGNSDIHYESSQKLGIIAAGQSNIEGRNSYSDLPSGFVNPNNKVHFCDNVNGTFSDFEITDGGSGNDWAFDAITYDLLTKTQYGNQSEIYVMKKTLGGSPIDPNGARQQCWTPDYEWLSNPSNSLLRTFESIIRKCVELQGQNFAIKAMLWHQGEGDADNEQVALRYYDNLKNMLAYVRGIVGNPRLHVFCGNLSIHNTYDPYVSIINDAYAKLASEDYYLHVVDMRNATLEDAWHFDYQSSIYFGQKVYDLMIDFGVITGTKINPVEPWN